MEEQRRLRGPGFAAWEVGPVAVVLGLAAHLISGGLSPSVPVLVALMALLSMCASFIALVRVPGWLLLVLCGVSQQVLHLAFDRLSGTYSGPLPAQHHQAAVWQPGQLTLLAGSPGHAQELLVDAHVAAALLTALLVAKADTSVARALTLLHRAGSGERPAARAGIR
jgi:hypothetical protein